MYCSCKCKCISIFSIKFQEAPSGCPPRFYQSVALSVLACFVDDEDIMTDASILFNIPELLIILENSDSEEYEVFNDETEKALIKLLIVRMT